MSNEDIKHVELLSLFHYIVGGIFMPFGTVLGVFTLIALNKDSIKEMFNKPNPPPPISTAPAL